MTYNNILEEAYSLLKKNKIDNYKYDAREILLELTGIDFANFLCICEKNLDNLYTKNDLDNLIDEFSRAIHLRSQHVPLQYILGKSYFCGFEFSVNQDVLIPRADTETLVEKFLLDNPDTNVDILDMCTGSGCIAIALSNLGKYNRIIGVDISDDALDIAAKNAETLLKKNENEDYQREIYFIQSDLFVELDVLNNKLGINKFDFITCNPPYIKTNDIYKLQDEVKNYEPTIALDGKKDGLEFYRRISKAAKEYLKNKGKIYLEIGYDQAKDVSNIFDKAGYKVIEIYKDIENRDRVVIVENE